MCMAPLKLLAKCYYPKDDSVSEGAMLLFINQITITKQNRENYGHR